MTLDECKALARYYLSYVDSIEPVQLPEDCYYYASNISAGDQASHVRYMLETIVNEFGEDRTHKAMRWIGFVQCWFWQMGDCSLEEIKTHSRCAVGK